jgi:CheY-like chemotaxis protein
MAHKLLLADDSVTIQRVIELTFADEDVQVLTAGDGEQAIASIQAERPDIVLADIGMPKRSGYDVAAFVKGAPELSHIPVLLLTGAFEPVDEGRARAAGCDGVLVKPFEPQHVIARVRELLRGVPGSGARPGGSVTRAVSDVPRPAERLAPHRAAPARPTAGNGDAFNVPPRDGGRGVSETALDDYFDRLDAAFANMSTPVEPSAAHQPEAPPRREGPVMERDLDWFDSPSEPPPAEHAAPGHHASSPERPDVIDVTPAPPIDPTPITFANPPSSPSWSLPRPPSIEPPDSPAEIAPEPARPAQTVQPQANESGSLIADAFSALLAAEQGEADAPPVRLSVGRDRPPVTDELVEDIANRVIERLGHKAVQDLVADVVSRVAERLVREEIERIRSKAK